MKEVTFSTQKEMQVIQLTDKIREKLNESKEEIKEGLLHVYAPHATGAVIINESADPNVRKDIINKLKDLFPKDDDYKHDRIDNNAHSHLMSTFIGCSETVPIKNNELKLGTWQNISFIETDGPRSKRKVYIQVIKSK
ncbi:MAG: secondary thiamine-phosphate synthase enzyme YjbQ [archaeon]